jgi:hypothetical protein
MNSRPGVHASKATPTPRASVGFEVLNGIMTFTESIVDERLRGALKVIAENTPGCVAVQTTGPRSSPIRASSFRRRGMNQPSRRDRRSVSIAAGSEKERDRPGGVRLDLRVKRS